VSVSLYERGTIILPLILVLVLVDSIVIVRRGNVKEIDRQEEGPGHIVPVFSSDIQ